MWENDIKLLTIFAFCPLPLRMPLAITAKSLALNEL